MTENINEWENRYQLNQTGWDRGEVSLNLLYWIEKGLLKPCRILVPGCGNGHEVLALAERGFDVVAIDIAPTPIQNMQTALHAKQLNAELIQADFLTWKPDKPFDAIYEQTSLCALPPEKRESYGKCLTSWLKPKGLLFAQFMQTRQENGPPFHCEVSAMRELFSADNWLWSEQHETTVTHSEGRYEKLFLLRKG